MKQFIINVPDDKRSFFEELMKNLDFSVLEANNVNVVSEPIPEWQKEIVRDRIETTEESDYLSWEIAKGQIRKKGK